MLIKVFFYQTIGRPPPLLPAVKVDDLFGVLMPERPLLGHNLRQSVNAYGTRSLNYNIGLGKTAEHPPFHLKGRVWDTVAIAVLLLRHSHFIKAYGFLTVDDGRTVFLIHKVDVGIKELFVEHKLYLLIYGILKRAGNLLGSLSNQ